MPATLAAPCDGAAISPNEQGRSKKLQFESGQRWLQCFAFGAERDSPRSRGGASAASSNQRALLVSVVEDLAADGAVQKPAEFEHPSSLRQAYHAVTALWSTGRPVRKCIRHHRMNSGHKKL